MSRWAAGDERRPVADGHDPLRQYGGARVGAARPPLERTAADTKRRPGRCPDDAGVAGVVPSGRQRRPPLLVAPLPMAAFAGEPPAPTPAALAP